MKNLILFLLLIQSLNVYSSIPKWSEVAREDNIKVFARESSDSTIPFKAEGLINANIDRVIEVLRNHQAKNSWAPKLKSVKIHKKLSSNEFIFSEYYKTPWPAYDREFLLRGSINKVSDDLYELKAKSINDKDLSDNGHVQADVKKINIVIKRISTTQTKLTFEFHGDMQGWMPIWLMNIIQKKWPLRFIQGLRNKTLTKI
jgi:hypothetical protein